MAERVGFEPTVPFGTPVFKTGTINRSDTSPYWIRHKVKKNGDPSEIRTPDTLIKSQVLCRLS